MKQAFKKISSLRVEDNIITDPKQIANHVVSNFQDIFDGNDDVHDNGMVDEVIPSLVTDNINNLLTIMPSFEEIKN
ncbi:hypothetical protein A2U01_0062027, partial [Trifolium medium]|nr:hypothetical protein [Trifolium medium]